MRQLTDQWQHLTTRADWAEMSKKAVMRQIVTLVMVFVLTLTVGCGGTAASSSFQSIT